MPKNILFVSCFRAVGRPLVPRSGDHEQCRLKLAATVLCTTGNRHTVRRRHPTRQLKCSYFMFFGKLCSVDIIWLSMLFYFGYAREDNLHWSDKFIWTSKMHGSSTCFTYPWNFPHFIINSVLVFCNGLTPFNGYVLRTFFTRKKGIDTLHVVFSWKAAPPIIVVSEQWLSAPSMVHFTPKGAPHSLLTFQHW